MAIKNCGCLNAFQDARYGKGRRVHNPTNEARSGKGLRCTVCKDVKSVAYVTPKNKGVRVTRKAKK